MFDIIVVGAGGAGLTAAIAAKKAGAKVLVICKTKAPFSSCTAYSGGGFTLASGRVSANEHFAFSQDVGGNISDPTLLEVLSQEGEAALRKIQSWGVNIRIGTNGHASVSHTAPKPVLGGGGLIRDLVNIAIEAGVSFLENTVVTKIVKNGNDVVGVECIEWTTRKATFLNAKSVVLAGGGAGQIYARTDNPARITGDGYALALEAGLALRDMEFVQFYPLGWHEEGFPTWMIGLQIIDTVRLTNARGEEFLADKLAKMGMSSGRKANLFGRDISARLVAEEASVGTVSLHLNELPQKEWDNPLLGELKKCYPKNTTPWERGAIRVSPVQHYFTGGVCIDASTRTSINGL
ncbi:MAG: FAD-binding protein, partial [bacterium]|nr:FAD-binding protein [bacterium]